MGNLCSTAQSDPFSGPGRPLGATPAKHASVSVPASASSPRQPRGRVLGGPPRTLGGAAAGTGEASGGGAEDARAKAAAAAEARFQQSRKGGKLQEKLHKERGRTDAQALREASAEESQHRTLDQSADALRHD
ncbi:hypothetical protein VTK56DRAFT_1619 [Thermocarpiscus australiensis]